MAGRQRLDVNDVRAYLTDNSYPEGCSANHKRINIAACCNNQVSDCFGIVKGNAQKHVSTFTYDVANLFDN